MKLSEDIKKKIDSYFDNITSDELNYIAINKYGFTLNNEREYDLKFYCVKNQNKYLSEKDIYETGCELNQEAALVA